MTAQRTARVRIIATATADWTETVEIPDDVLPDEVDGWIAEWASVSDEPDPVGQRAPCLSDDPDGSRTIFAAVEAAVPVAARRRPCFNAPHQPGDLTP